MSSRIRPAIALAALAALALAGAAVGCGREPTDSATEGLAPETFVQVVVALREAEREAVETDSAKAVFEARKAEILAEHGATEEELRDFVLRHQADFALMNRLWDTIAQRLKYVPVPEEADESLRIEDRR